MAAGMLMGGFAEAHAGTSTQTLDFSVNADDSSVIPVSTPKAFSGFNLLGATLVQADLYLYDPASGFLATSHAQLTGSEGGSAALLASFAVKHDILGTPFSLTNLNSGTASMQDYNYNIETVPATKTATAADFNQSHVTYNGDLSEFLKALVTFNAVIDGFDTTTADCNSGYGGNTCAHSASFTGTLELVYTYNENTPVPEPGSVALLATASVGLLGASARRVRRRTKPN